MLATTAPAGAAVIGSEAKRTNQKAMSQTLQKKTFLLVAALAGAVTAPSAASAQNAACPAPGSVRSDNSRQKATVEFQNLSGRKVTIYWLDYQGQRKFYKELQPRQNYKQNTFVTHPWVAVDPSGRCIGGVFRPNPGRNTFQVI